MKFHRSFAERTQVEVTLRDPGMLWADASHLALSATEDGKLFMGFWTHWLDATPIVFPLGKGKD